jgi:hypothetical protein
MTLVNETLDDVDAMLWKELKRAENETETANTLAMARLFDKIREEFTWNLSAKVNADVAA